MLLISLMDVDLHHLQCSDNKWYDIKLFIFYFNESNIPIYVYFLIYIKYIFICFKGA